MDKNKSSVVLVNACPSLGRKVMTLPELVSGSIGTWQYMFCGKMKSLPVMLIDYTLTDVDYLTSNHDDDYGHIVMKYDGLMFEITYKIIR